MIVTRQARPEDWLDAGRVHVAGWRYAYRGVFEDEFLDRLTPEGMSGWRKVRYRNPRWDAGHLVVTRGGVVRGFCDVASSRSDDRTDITGELYAIYLDPDFIGHGLGRRLIAASRQRLRDLGHERAELWVLDSNAQTRRFYEADGWEPDGSQKQEEFGGTTITELRYVRDL